MDNNLNYSVAERKDPRNPEQEGLYYAHVRSRGVLDTKELIERIRNRGTVGSPDIVAVLITMEDIVTEALCNGEIVRLGELGSLSLSVSSTGCRSKEDFDSKHITKVRAIFKEGRTLRCGMATVHFKKVE